MKPMRKQKENKPEETNETDRKAGIELSDEEMDGVAGGVTLYREKDSLGKHTVAGEM